MKKIILFLMTIMLVTGCSVLKSKVKRNIPIDLTEGTPILTLSEYSGFNINDVSSLSIIKYTEGGADETKVTDSYQISKEYDSIKKIKITSETKMACEDNTTIYKFNMSNGKSYSFEFECEWLVIGSKRYNYK